MAPLTLTCWRDITVPQPSIAKPIVIRAADRPVVVGILSAPSISALTAARSTMRRRLSMVATTSSVHPTAIITAPAMGTATEISTNCASITSGSVVALRWCSHGTPSRKAAADNSSHSTQAMAMGACPCTTIATGRATAAKQAGTTC